MGDFVHLHVHSQYSFLDGTAKPSELAQRAKELNMRAIALTDSRAMYGVIDFYNECLARGIKPIIGCQIKVVDYSGSDNINNCNNGNNICKNNNNDIDNNISKNNDNNEKNKNGEIYSLILLAKNFEGYCNLISLVNSSHLRMCHGVPFIYENELIKKRDGLIILIGSLQSRLTNHLLRCEYSKAEKLIRRYLEIFGKKNLYLELQDHENKEEKVLCRRIIRLGQKLKLNLVTTNDVHYLHKEDYSLYKLLSQLESMSITSDSSKEKIYNENYYLKSFIEMKGLFSSFPHAIKSSLEIAEKCNLKLPLNNTKLPHFQTPLGFTDEQYLRKLCYESVEKRYPNNNNNNNENDALKEIVMNRLKYELDVICDMEYAGYFLIIWDMAKFARERKIPMCTKGSAAGSLVTYLLKISDVDPIKNNLCFERFLNKERGKLPDVDIDFCQRGREEIFDYLTKRYGKSHVSRVSCFSTLQLRGAIREVGRVLNLQKEEVDIIAKRIPHSFMVRLGRQGQLPSPKSLDLGRGLNREV